MVPWGRLLVSNVTRNESFTFVIRQQRQQQKSLSNSRRMSKQEDELKYVCSEGSNIIILGLNRPKARNALNLNLISLLSSALEQIDSSCNAVILRSVTPGIFCAGADLKERSDATPADNLVWSTKARRMVTALTSISVPVIAAVDGPALGGGLELALACDLRVASDTAKMGLPETKLGIIPGLGGTQRLPRVVGIAKAKELIFTGRIINGMEAEKMGLVNHLVKQNSDGNAAFLTAMELASEIVAAKHKEKNDT